MNRERLSVTGMSCTGCERAVESALENLDCVTRVDADRESDAVNVVVEDDATDAELRAAIEDAGYDVAA